jgi:transcriptional regulator with XRE-family HTH domain
MSADLAEHVAAEVRAEMARQGVKQGQVAEALGISRVAAQRRINGEMPWDVAELAQVASFLGKPIAQFMPVERVA